MRTRGNRSMTKIHVHKEDLPAHLELGEEIAVDTETLGLNLFRDRLCLVQLFDGQSCVHCVQFSKPGNRDAPNLRRLLTNPKKLKIFHFARFDLAVLQRYLNIACQPVYCTRTASRLTRTYSSFHGLADLCAELLGIKLSKESQSSDWGRETLTQAQLSYAAADVLHLHALRRRLDDMLKREERTSLAQGCFDFLPTQAQLDLHGWREEDIFAHRAGKR